MQTKKKNSAGIFILLLAACGILASACSEEDSLNMNDPIESCRGLSGWESTPVSFSHYNPRPKLWFEYNDGNPYVKLDGNFEDFRSGDYLFGYVTQETLEGEEGIEEEDVLPLIENDTDVFNGKTYTLSEENLKTLTEHFVIRLAGIELYSTTYASINQVCTCFYDRIQAAK